MSTYTGRQIAVPTVVEAKLIRNVNWFGVAVGNEVAQIRIDRCFGSYGGLIDWFFQYTEKTPKPRVVWRRWFDLPSCRVTFSCPEFERSTRRGIVWRYDLRQTYQQARRTVDYQYDWKVTATVVARAGFLLKVGTQQLPQTTFQTIAAHVGWWHKTATEGICCE